MPAKYPIIYDVSFGGEGNLEEYTERDAAINSEILRAALSIVSPRYENGQFATGRSWRVRIEDQHTAEASPHYVLDFGEGGLQELGIDWTILPVGYCDNYSSTACTIKQAPGTFTVKVAGDFGNYGNQLVAVSIANDYVKALNRHLPNYCIVFDENALMFPK